MKVRLFSASLLFSLFLVLLFAGPALAGDESPSEPAELTGVLSIVWGDPGPGDPSAPTQQFFLQTSTGVRYELLLPSVVLEQQGGAAALHGRTVTVRGPQVAAVAAADRSPESLPPISVESLTLGAAGPAAAPDLAGSQPWVSILCKFADVSAEQHPRSYYETQLGNSYPGMDHYWREASYDKINVVGSEAVGWYTLPQPRSYYIYDANGDGYSEANLQRLAEDCSRAADADVYFPDFVGIHFMFNDWLDCCSWGGGWNLGLDGKQLHYRATWLASWGHTNQSVVAHEMGHGFGMPHSSGMYGQTYDNTWDVMSNCYISPADPTWGTIGQHPIAHQKYILDWLPPARVLDINAFQQTFTLAQLAKPPSSGYLMAQVPFPGSDTDYYTIEARRRVGYDEYLPGDAIIIHQKTKDRGEPLVLDVDGNGYTGDAGAMWIPGETFKDDTRGITVKVNSSGSNSFSVTVTTRNPPRLVRPGPDVALEPGEVTFEWLALAGATGYEFQMDTSPSFDSPAKVTINLTGTAYKATFNTLGRRYWRVRGLPNGFYTAAKALLIAEPALRITNDDGDDLPQLLTGSDGKLHLFYASMRNGQHAVWRQTSSDSGLTWDTPVPVTNADKWELTMAAGPAGRMWMAWQESGQLYVATSGDDGQTWSARQQISEGGPNTYRPSLLRSRDGHLWLAASRYENNGAQIHLWESRDEGVSWASPVRLSDGELWHSNPVLAQTSNGSLLLVWSRNGDLVKRTSSSGASWSQTEPLGTGCCRYPSSIAVEPSGLTTLVTAQNNTPWYMTSLDHGATWSQAFPLSRYGGYDVDGRVAPLLGGGVAAVWVSSRGEALRPHVWFGKLGEREDTNPPPYVSTGSTIPRWPVTPGELTFYTWAKDDAPGMQVELLWSIAGVEQPRLALNDEGRDGDERAGDGTWSVRTGPSIAGTIAYRFRAADARSNIGYSSIEPQRLQVNDPFAKQHPLLFVSDGPEWDTMDWTGKYYAGVLSDLYYEYDLWDARLRGPVPESVLEQYLGGALIWSAPQHPDLLGYTEGLEAVENFLERGGCLLITGAAIASHFQNSNFLSDYLHANYDGSATHDAVAGVAGDVIGDGLSFGLSGGASANNQWSSGTIQPVDPAAVAFSYTSPELAPAAVRVDTGSYRVAFFSFGLEGINDLEARSAVLERTLTWLGQAPPPRASLIAPADAALLPPGQTIFSWRPVSGATGYRFQVAQTADFAAPMIDAETSGTSFGLTQILQGQFYWRVLAHPGDLPSRTRAITWRSPAQPLAVGNDPRSAALANSDGQLWAVYEQSGLLMRRTSSDGGGTWSDAGRLFPNLSPVLDGRDPSLAAGAGGRLWVAWLRGGGIALSSTADRGVTWTAQREGPDSPGLDDFPALVETAMGRLVIVWQGSVNGNYSLFASTSADAGVTWSPPVELVSAYSANPALAESASGKLLVAWTGNGRINMKASSDGTTWSDLPPPVAACCAEQPALARDAGGRIWLAYASQGDLWLQSSQDDAATWSRPERLTYYVGADHSPALAAIGAGKPAVAWNSARGGWHQAGVWFLRPGFWEDTDPPPALMSTFITPRWPTSADTIAVTANASDESPGLSVHLQWSVDDGPVNSLPLYDDGAHGDQSPGDAYWGGSLGPLPSGTQLSYQARAIDARGNEVIYPPQPVHVTVQAPFVKANDLLLALDPGGSENPTAARYAAALDQLGYGYDLWPTSARGPVPSAILNQYLPGAVVWAAESGTALVYWEQRSAMTGFLEAGGRLFLSGPRVFPYLSGDTAFLASLGIAGAVDGIAAPAAQGVDGDPLGDGLSLSFRGGDSPPVHDAMAALTPLDPAVAVLRYSLSSDSPERIAGLRVDTGKYRVASLGFGVDALNSPATRAQLMDRALGWLGVPPVPRVRAYLDPPQGRVAPGHVRRFDLYLDAGVQRVDAASIVLAFDPNRLQIVTASGQPAASIEANPAAFASVTVNLVDNAGGRLEFSGSAPARAPEGLIGVARFWVRPVGEDASAVSFEPSTAVSYRGQPVLAATAGAQVVVGMHHGFLPLARR